MVCVMSHSKADREIVPSYLIKFVKNNFEIQKNSDDLIFYFKDMMVCMKIEKKKKQKT